MQKMVQDRVNEDATARKEPHDIVCFPGDSCKAEKSCKLQMRDNFAKLKQLFRSPCKTNWLDICATGPDLMLAPKNINNNEKANATRPSSSAMKRTTENLSSSSMHQLSEQITLQASSEANDVPAEALNAHNKSQDIDHASASTCSNDTNCVDNNDNDNVNAESNAGAPSAGCNNNESRIIENSIEELSQVNDNNAAMRIPSAFDSISLSASTISQQHRNENNTNAAVSSSRGRCNAHPPDYYHNSQYANDNIEHSRASLHHQMNNIGSQGSSQSEFEAINI